ncbi:fibronectin type III domain-containing protein, partial [bacterium]|nr:fibronectin type III domain-containing protein [bacterium]
FLLTPSLFSQELLDELRLTQPIIIIAENTPEYLGYPVSEIVAFNFDQGTDTWHQIQLQIDEIGPEIHPNFYEPTKIDTLYNWFGETDGFLGSTEALIFMARDAGDKAPVESWITNRRSRDFPRIQIVITDPTSPDLARYIYLYRTATLITGPESPPYVLLTPALSDTTGDDIVTAVAYQEGHDANGFTSDWVFPMEYGATEILDLLKMRLKADFGLFTISLLEEDALDFDKFDYVIGPVRIIRRLNYLLVFELFINPIGDAKFTTFFYPYHTTVLGPKKKLDESWGISYLRQSFDLNANGFDMQFFNEFNPDGIRIDGSPDSVNVTMKAYPEINWHMISGDPGSILFTYTSPQLGENHQLYYFDNVAALCGDGFDRDSGDDMSFGDIGIAVSGENMAGSFGMSYRALFLPPQQTPDLGPTLVSQLTNPLETHFSVMEFDITPPGPITDLYISNISPESLVLTWTAPFENGTQGGAIQQYDIRYDTHPPDDNMDTWWDAATVISTPPTPETPETSQSFEVSGLHQGRFYYFAICGQDNAGLWSDYSNIAMQATSPVELTVFSVTAEKNTVTLSWATASETNNHGFEIERQQGKSAFETAWNIIGFLPGHGTSTIPRHYIFTDSNLRPGSYFYRLKQIDKNGT